MHGAGETAYARLAQPIRQRSADPDREAGNGCRHSRPHAFHDVRCNYQVHQVGGQTILEYWIPAEDLAALNASIVGGIELVAEFH